MATCSECEREARKAAANLVLSTVRMGTPGQHAEVLRQHRLQAGSVHLCRTCQGRPEPVGPATELEHRLAEWLERRAAAPPVKSPRQPFA